MGLLSKLKKGKKTINWDKAYKATPKFYSKPDGHPFGAIALTEGTDSILPKAPQNEYTIDGKQITDWKIVLISTTKDSIIGDCDYFVAFNKLKNYMIDSNDNSVLIRGLSLKELEAINLL